MGIKAASCSQLQTRGMIFWDDTGDKNDVICLPSLNENVCCHDILLPGLRKLGLTFFSEHLLKCVYFYNLSNTTLEGGSSADKVL